MSKPSYEVINRSKIKIYKSVTCLLRRDTDVDVIKWLEREDTPSPSTMLREAVRQEIKSGQWDKKGE